MPKICKAVGNFFFVCKYFLLFIFVHFFPHQTFFSAARISFCHANLKGLEQDLLAHTLHPNDTHDLATRFFFIYIFFQNGCFYT